jgi:hypothetical protein
MFNFTDSQYTSKVENSNFSLEHYFLIEEVESIIGDMLSHLNKTDAYIITSLCCDGETIRSVAKLAGVSIERAQAVKDKFCEEARSELSAYYMC